MVLYRQIKGNDLIKQNQKTRTTIQNHPKENKKKIRKKQKRKQADDEPFNRQEVYII